MWEEMKNHIEWKVLSITNVGAKQFSNLINSNINLTIRYSVVALDLLKILQPKGGSFK